MFSSAGYAVWVFLGPTGAENLLINIYIYIYIYIYIFIYYYFYANISIPESQTAGGSACVTTRMCALLCKGLVISRLWCGYEMGFGGSGCSRGVWWVYLHKAAPLCSRLHKFPFCLFYEVFLKVPPTKSAAGQRLRDAGSNPGLDDRPRGLYQHRQDPTS
jgi:hypothetical protein